MRNNFVHETNSKKLCDFSNLQTAHNCTISHRRLLVKTGKSPQLSARSVMVVVSEVCSQNFANLGLERQRAVARGSP